MTPAGKLALLTDLLYESVYDEFGHLVETRPRQQLTEEDVQELLQALDSTDLSEE